VAAGSKKIGSGTISCHLIEVLPNLSVRPQNLVPPEKRKI